MPNKAAWSGGGLRAQGRQVGLVEVTEYVPEVERGTVRDLLYELGLVTDVHRTKLVDREVIDRPR